MQTVVVGGGGGLKSWIIFFLSQLPCLSDRCTSCFEGGEQQNGSLLTFAMVAVVAVTKHVSASSSFCLAPAGSSPPSCALGHAANTVNVDQIVLCMRSVVGASTAPGDRKHAARNCLMSAWKSLSARERSHRGI